MRINRRASCICCAGVPQIDKGSSISSDINHFQTGARLFTKLADRTTYIFAASATTCTSAWDESSFRDSIPTPVQVRAVCPAYVVHLRTIPTARTSRIHTRFITVATSVLVRAAPLTSRRENASFAICSSSNLCQ